MITITNSKIAGFEPRWAPFRGFSLLFDNPGDSVSSMGRDWLKVDCSVDESEDLQLYKGFAEFLNEIGRYRLTNTYLFCPLPPYSYHVTVWDGLNDGNVQDVSADCHLRLKNFLKNLPGSLLTDKEFTNEVRHSPLITSTNRSIRFKFKRLAKWGNEVLVASLMPADQDSERELKRIVEDRKALSAWFRERFGVTMRSSYSPHVTLGYFANEEYAASATPEIDRWTESVKKRVDQLTITFSGISLYGFTDMVTFFKETQRG
ncbi:MAG: hypothetical protein DRI79_06165 [Chloroflexi bacterium]|nr:MAG: hypothetical protein DRI80_07655 [Chloroflexota bacterium]RLC89748.1 MAG: hypothetical protein DRI79_06165 [Chloroflexota bacterium]